MLGWLTELGCPEVVNFLLFLVLLGIRPTSEGACWSATNEYRETVDRYCLINVATHLPDKDMGHFLSVSKYFHSLAHDICVAKLQCQFGIEPSDYNKNPVKLYRRLLNVPICTKSANEAAGSRDLAAVKYLVSFGVRPTSKGADLAAMTGNFKMIKYLLSLDIPPTPHGVNLAAMYGRYGMLKMVKFLVKELHIYPTSRGSDWAAMNGDFDTVRYLISIGVRPTSEGAEWAVQKGHSEMLEYLATLGISPPPSL